MLVDRQRIADMNLSPLLHEGESGRERGHGRKKAGFLGRYTIRDAPTDQTEAQYGGETDDRASSRYRIRLHSASNRSIPAIYSAFRKRRHRPLKLRGRGAIPPQRAFPFPTRNDRCGFHNFATTILNNYRDPLRI